MRPGAQWIQAAAHGLGLFLLFSLLRLSPNALAEDFTGVGATFPYPLYAKWAVRYAAVSTTRINYQPMGSAAGINQLLANTVDFGATDKPLERATLDRLQLIQFPATIGGIVPVVNLGALNSTALRLTGTLLAQIFLGKITRWNDRRLVALNPHLASVSVPITVVRRAEGSGTTFGFTHYLSAVDRDWRLKVGFGAAVRWPIGVAGKGNDGLAAYVQRIQGSIGYVEYAYAKKMAVQRVWLNNASGLFVAPTPQSFTAAAAAATWDATQGFYKILTNEPGGQVWPITTASFILVNPHKYDCARTQTLLNFFRWTFRHGQAEAIQLDYVPLPAQLTRQIEESWKTLSCAISHQKPAH